MHFMDLTARNNRSLLGGYLGQNHLCLFFRGAPTLRGRETDGQLQTIAANENTRDEKGGHAESGMKEPERKAVARGINSSPTTGPRDTSRQGLPVTARSFSEAPIESFNEDIRREEDEPPSRAVNSARCD